MVCLNAGISSFSEAKYWHRALGLMDEAQGTGLQIDVVTIGSLMKGVPKWTWSLNLLERMEQLRGSDLNTITFNAAINACEEGGAWEVALAIMDNLAHSYLPLTMITWNSCINSWHLHPAGPCEWQVPRDPMSLGQPWPQNSGFQGAWRVVRPQGVAARF
eukprot:symbB.v1.2.034924.t1/scaffold4596.1/size37583/3